MAPLAHNKFCNFSEGLFQRLLVIYPKAHRDEYGPYMSQLFRDQCRDAWRADGNRGLIKLWLQVFPDLLRTSLIEHVTAFKEKTMNDRIDRLLRPHSAPLRIFVATFAGVFVVAFATSILITFILPESYGGTARIRIGAQDGTYDPYFIQKEFEVIQSDVILGRVVDYLDLKAEWGRKYRGGPPLETSDAVELLRRRIALQPIRNTQLVEIRSFSDNPREAARVANGIAKAYTNYRLELNRQGRMPEGSRPVDRMVEIVDEAVPNDNPVAPNKALNIFLGAVTGIILGLAIGGGIGGIAFLFRQKVQKNPV